MPVPKKIKDAVDNAVENELDIEMPADIDIPPLEWFDMNMVKVRDDIAKHAGAVPEDVQLIGIKVFYKIGEERTQGREYFAVGVRCKYDPRYLEMLEQLP